MLFSRERQHITSVVSYTLLHVLAITSASFAPLPSGVVRIFVQGNPLFIPDFYLPASHSLPVVNDQYQLPADIDTFMYDLISARSESNSPKPGPKPQPKHVIQIARPDGTDKRYCSAVDRSLVE
jgi:hypothetical protein